MSTSRKKLLIIEDEMAIAQGLIDLFTFHGYSVDHANDGQTGLQRALSNQYHLLILDVMLPGLDGFSICNQIREHDREVPIIMLTAKSTEDDLIMGLSLGADEYITKPFSVRALVLRVEAILRRTYGDSENQRFVQIGEYLVVDCLNLRSIDPAQPELAFSRREVEILRFLTQQGDRPTSRAELLSHVWGYQRAREVETRTVDIHIAKLRRKIEADPKTPRYLQTIRGEGYKLLQSRFTKGEGNDA